MHTDNTSLFKNLQLVGIKPEDVVIQTYTDSKLMTDREDKPDTLAKIFNYDQSRVEKYVNLGAGVYWCINPQEKRDFRRNKNTVKFAAIGFDLDAAKEGDNVNKDVVFEGKKKILNKLDSLPFRPTGIIETKNGIQPYWIFSNAIELKTEKERDEVAALYLGLRNSFHKRTGLASEGDSLCRVLRLPGTLHQKDPKDTFEIKEISGTGELVDFNKFLEEYPISVAAPMRGWKEACDKDSIYGVSVESALTRLSGNVLVNGEVYGFKDNTNGTKQIVINGKVHSCWIDVDRNTIGSRAGGSPVNIVGWVKYYHPEMSDEDIRGELDKLLLPEKITGVNKENLISEPLSFETVADKVKSLIPNSQTALKLLLAVAVSGYFNDSVMLWLLFVGVPSSGKTDIVRLIKSADLTYYLDNLTQNAFISGERSGKNNKVYDLLPLIDKKCLVIKDWTSIFSLDEKMTKKLLGDLVGIYDKEFTKFSSRRGNISYSSSFSQIGCITPATLNKHTNYMNMVGPRFLCYTMPSSTPDSENQSYQGIFSGVNRSVIEKEARLYTSSYLNQLVQKVPHIKPLSKDAQNYLRLAANLMSCCRGIVVLQSASFINEEGKEIKYYEVLDVQIEEPWRAIQQLISLTKNLAFVVGRDEVGIEELGIIKEVVISSMPADRSQALRIIKEHAGKITASELSDVFEKSVRTSRRLLEELYGLKALEKDKGTGSIANDYRITDQFKDFLLLDTAEFMSAYSSGTETPHSMQLEQKEVENEPLPY